MSEGLKMTLTGSLVFGLPGKDGKTAYEYAKEGGYTGTEEEFKKKMAAEYAPQSDVGTLSELETEAKDSLVAAINELVVLLGGNADQGGGLSAAAAALLITILRNGVYSTSQTANITALEAALASSDSEEPGEDTPESGVTQTGSVLYIVSGVTVTQSGSVLTVV